MKEFFEGIRVELHEGDVLVGGVADRYFTRLAEDFLKLWWSDRVVARLAYLDRPLLDFIPKRKR